MVLELCYSLCRMREDEQIKTALNRDQKVRSKPCVQGKFSRQRKYKHLSPENNKKKKPERYEL